MENQQIQVILVDENDQELGVMDKLEAHEKGILHRAFSIFIFNDKQELLIQQRAATKYHGGSLWTNTCCSHPNPGENTSEAAYRRLNEEMGMECELEFKDTLLYQTPVENNLIEHEFDYVFVGYCNIDPIPNPEEVMNWKWASIETIEQEISESPDRFTYWFKMILPKIKNKI